MADLVLQSWGLSGLPLQAQSMGFLAQSSAVRGVAAFSHLRQAKAHVCIRVAWFALSGSPLATAAGGVCFTGSVKADIA